ncbi:MAG: hypothetical protein ACQEWU_11490 [Bacillota bacterium]|uniref:Uncharacterized protein n=1 Tax=Virgibacillus salarius TaxID=447199 RepID=A0A941DXW9_9BACI|nr:MULTISPECIES: hypothetical protein [Bacillaceae]MBR7796183.1 hypothetical protein [Virgibacillus salarius]MCC2249696.1 hypothetical protein [Virgibacillus sp. AGTR]MDY7042687.1 hypothetical protein [Virgibacillus sp. M23]NAZ08891.1 hypothetical protein [Agaribacter marinus]
MTPGDIILLDDSGGNRSQTVESLEDILAYFQRLNYQMVTVFELLLYGSTNQFNPLLFYP